MDELGLVLQTEGRREEALLEFKKIIKREPSNAGVYSNMGICLEAMNRDDQALEAFKKAIELKPNLRSAHVDIANFYRYHDKPAKAIRHLKRAIEITPSDPIAHGGLGAVLSDMKRWAEAERQYRVLLKIAPKNVHGITELGNALLRQGHVEDSIAQFEEAMEISHGKWVRAMDGLARAYREKHDLKQAEKFARMAIKMRPVDVQSRDVLASVFAAEGHSKRAAEEYATALRYNPSDKVAKARLPKLVISDEAKGEISLHSDLFAGVDLSNPDRKKLNDKLSDAANVVSQESEVSSHSRKRSSIKYILVGSLLVFAGTALALYVGCCGGASHGSEPGYAPIASHDDAANNFPNSDDYNL